MQFKKNILALLLLLAFTAAQATSLHEFSHDDQDVHCELCAVAHEFQSASFDLQPDLSFESLSMIPDHEEIFSFPAFAKANSFLRVHTTRPPPAGV